LTVSTIDSVTTADATPTTAPNKISNIATKNRAVLRFTPTTGDSSTIRAWRATFNGNRKLGTVVGKQGVVCGLDRLDGRPPLSRTQGVQITENIDYPETGGVADGSYTVEVAALSDTEGWG
jgi:hypothetical protein